MYKSISYLEISCNYNHDELVRSVLSKANTGKAFDVLFRNRKYYLHYDSKVNMFYLFNRFQDLVAIIAEGQFQFFASVALEIGLEHVFSLLARLNIYPVNR